MKAPEYINKIKATAPQSAIEPTGLKRDLYLDIIEKVLDGYGYDYFSRIVSGEETFVISVGLRAAGALSYLLASGRKAEWYGLWVELMDRSCAAVTKSEGSGEFDLTVQELLIALKNMKIKVSAEDNARWRLALEKLDRNKLYAFQMKDTKEETKLTNITIYNMAGEYLRETEGMTDTQEYFGRHIPWLLNRFDENGMFVDYDCAMLYDLTTRCRIALMLWHGYDGSGREALEVFLEKGGLMTLLMQSSQYQLPYGGRSNQYLFNECLVASCCEYEAVRYAKRGDLSLAGMFKRCAHKSAATILRFLNEKPPRHNKNFFASDTGFGIDSYGTFARYMIAAACFIGYGYTFANDSIPECACPPEIGGYVLETTGSFHKVFANCCGHSIELELAADTRQDSTGLGRYHKAGIPIELGLSMPFTANHKYSLPENLFNRNISICTGWKNSNGEAEFISGLDGTAQAKVCIREESFDRVVFSVEYTINSESCSKVIETYTLDRNGVLIESALCGAAYDEIYFTVPLLYSNGKDITRIEAEKASSLNKVSVRLADNVYSVEANGEIGIEKDEYGNRNGIYQLAVIHGQGRKLAVRLNLY